METEWELHYGMGMGMETPEEFGAAAPAYMYSGVPSAAETLRVDDLLDFTNHELFSSSSSSSSSAAADAHLLTSQEFSSAAAAGSAFGFDAVNSSNSNYPRHSSFTDDIYIPSEEVAELEWLSHFVEESFSDVPYPNYLAEKTMWQDGNNIHQAWSQRSRDVGAASSSSSSASEFPTTTGKANASSRKKLQEAAEAVGTVDGGVRRCTHCASEKTPQWRTGPLGPKTLCNACGVRYKSGRLVPEYRPAASPTFVLTQHSNSHRKVVELRRQKELLILRRNENDTSAAALPELRFLDYEVC